MTTYPQIVVTVGACLFAFTAGLIALVWPEKMQRYALKRSTKFYFWPNPLLGWMKTSGYIVYLRVMGVVFLCFGLLVLLAGLAALKKQPVRHSRTLRPLSGNRVNRPSAATVRFDYFSNAVAG